MAQNNVNNNSNGSLFEKLKTKVQDAKKTIDAVNAENAKANAQAKAVQDEIILKTFGMDKKNSTGSSTNSLGSNNKVTTSSNSIKNNTNRLTNTGKSEINLQSDKFVQADNEIKRSAHNLGSIKEVFNDIIDRAKILDEYDRKALSNDLGTVKNIESNVNGISGDLTTIKAKMNIIDPDFGQNMYLFDLANNYGASLFEKSLNKEEKNDQNKEKTRSSFFLVASAAEVDPADIANVSPNGGDNLLKDGAVPTENVTVDVNNNQLFKNYRKISEDGIMYQYDIYGDVTEDTAVILLNHGGHSADSAYGDGGDYKHYENWKNDDSKEKPNVVVVRFGRNYNNIENAHKLLDEVCAEYSIPLENCSTAGFSNGGAHALQQMADFVKEHPEIENPTVVLIDSYLHDGAGATLNSEELTALGNSGAVVVDIRRNGITDDIDDYEKYSEEYGIKFVKINDVYSIYSHADDAHQGAFKSYFDLGYINYQAGQGKFPSGTFKNGLGQDVDCIEDVTVYNAETQLWESLDIGGKTIDETYEAIDINVEDKDTSFSTNIFNNNINYEINPVELERRVANAYVISSGLANAYGPNGNEYILNEIEKIWNKYDGREQTVNALLKMHELAADKNIRINYAHEGTWGNSEETKQKVKTSIAASGIDCNAWSSWGIWGDPNVDGTWKRVDEFLTLGKEVAYEYAQPADVFVRVVGDSQHVGTIIANYPDDGRVLVSEASGQGQGVVLRYRTYDELSKYGYHMRDLSEVYGEISNNKPVTTPTQKEEVPKEETPKIESPKVEVPKEETPKVETPKVEVPKEETPKVETPKVEVPKEETPKVESPKVEVPKEETPKVESPKVEVPKEEPPKVESPKVDVPKEETPKVETPKVEVPKDETPKVESPKVEVPKEETPKVESPKVEVPKEETPKVESPKVEVPKEETPKVESPKVEVPKEETPKVEVSKPIVDKEETSNIDLTRPSVDNDESIKYDSNNGYINPNKDSSSNLDNYSGSKNDNNASKYILPGVLGTGLALMASKIGKFIKKNKDNNDV